MDGEGVGKAPDQGELFDSSSLVVVPPALPVVDERQAMSTSRGELTSELWGGRVTLQVIAQRPLNEMDRRMLWEMAAANWLALQESASTVRAYKSAWDLLIRYTGKEYWQIEQGDVIQWLRTMSDAGASKATVNLRLAGISSFYRYVIEDFTHTLLVRSDGTHGRLTDYNPAGGTKIREKYKVKAFGRSLYLDKTQLRAFLGAIKRDTVQGLRDFALFFAYVETGRRNQEVRNLKWKDIDRSGERIVYTWSGKGKENVKREMPVPVWEAIEVYLKAAGRWETMQPEDYIFTALSDHARRMKRRDGRPMVESPDWQPGREPLSAHTVNDLMKKYCRKAGITQDRAHVHALRHSSAMLRLESGQRLEEIQDHLGHEQVGTTQIYIQEALKQIPDKGWVAAHALLGVEATLMPAPSPKRRNRAMNGQHP